MNFERLGADNSAAGACPRYFLTGFLSHSIICAFATSTREETQAARPIYLLLVGTLV
jgi:hypothetical protein